MTKRLLVLCLLLGGPMAPALRALDLTATGDYRFSVPADVSYADQAVAIDETASTTNYPGILYPPGQEIVLWRNIQLADIKTFKAKIGGRLYESEDVNRLWLDATVYHQETNANGAVECQFQLKRNSFIYSVRVVFRQRGNDVVGRVGFGNTDRIRYTYISAERDIGYDFRKTGDGSTTLARSALTCANAQCCIKQLQCVLNEGVAVKEAPARVVFDNTDETVWGEDVLETNTYAEVVWPKETDIVAFRGVALEDVVALSGELGGTKVGSQWRAAKGYFKKVARDGMGNAVLTTNAGSRVTFQIQYKHGSSLCCCNVQLRQYGGELLARMSSSEWGYGKVLGVHDFDDSGSTLTYGNTVDGAELALRNLVLVSRKRTVRRVMVKTNPLCMMRDGWVKLWPGTSLEDVVPVAARMGGKTVGSAWRRVLAWLPVSYADRTEWYFQTQYDSSIRSMRVAFAQEGTDVWARGRTVTYGHGKPLPWAAGTGEYQSAWTNTVDGKSAVNTLALCDLTCARWARPLHTVTVGENFTLRGTPIHLRDVELKVAPAAGKSVVLDSSVTGYGCVTAAGAGTVALTGAMTDGVSLKIAAGGALACDLSAGAVPLVNQGVALQIEPGARLCFRSTAPVKAWLPTATPIPLTAGAQLPATAAENLSALVEGGGLVAYKVAFSVVEGELYVTFTRKPGFSLLLQ